MSGQFTINLSKPISTITILDSKPAPTGSEFGHENFANPDNTENLENTSLQISELQKELTDTCKILNDITTKLTNFYTTLLKEHKDQIARLSVEIARKILIQKVNDGDYEIETIIKEIIQNAPSCQDIVIHLHPKDLQRYENTVKNNPDCILQGIEFVPDPNIGLAECKLKSPKGDIEFIIDEHLDKISEALKKAK